MDFQTAYDALEQCLANYVTLKKDSGWTKQVKSFQQFSLLIILQTQDVQFLITKVKELSDSLFSTVNWATLGLVGGSTLKADLQKILEDIAKPPALQISFEADTASQDSQDSQDSQAGPPKLAISLESPPSSITSLPSASSPSRDVSLPASAVSVTSYLPSRADLCISNVVYRHLAAEQLRKNKLKNQYIADAVFMQKPRSAS